MSKLTIQELRKARDAAIDVIEALKEPHRDSARMVENWDFLNDTAAPPEKVKSMADEIINLREMNKRLHAQRVADRRRFSNPAPEHVIDQAVKVLGGDNG